MLCTDGAGIITKPNEGLAKMTAAIVAAVCEAAASHVRDGITRSDYLNAHLRHQYDTSATHECHTL